MGRSDRARRRRYLALVPPAVVIVRRRRKLGLPVPLSAPMAWTVPVAVARGVRPGRRRAAAIWAAQMWAYKVSFAMPYDRPDALYRRLRIDYPIDIDRRLGRGVPPGERLQRRFRRPPALTTLDRLLTAVYTAWEIEPHAALAWVLWRHPDRFRLAALRLGATFDCTLLGYAAVPTAPPWWASEREGRLGRAVRRVSDEVIRDVRGDPRPTVAHNTGANPWASMPSDHFGAAAGAAMMLGEIDARLGAAAWAYALVLGFALVYLGEHYVIDLLAGLTVAVAVHLGAQPLSEPAGTLLDALGGTPRRRLRAARRRRRLVPGILRPGVGG